MEHNPSADEGLVEALYTIQAYLSESVKIPDDASVDWDHEGTDFTYRHLRLVFNAALGTESKWVQDVAETAFKAGLRYAADEGWAYMPDELEQSVLAGNAALAAARSHGGM